MFIIERNRDKHNLIEAGPGAGKTYSLIKKVLKCLEEVEPYRCIVVITYTNSAKNEILNRLKEKVDIPENLFVGTIHSFFIKFIIKPYYRLKVDLNGKNVKYGEFNKRVGSKNENYKVSSVLNKRYNEKLLENGCISYDEIINLSEEIIKDLHISKSVSKRIKYLFIDEFQDATNKQAEIVKKIMNAGYTTVTCIGDREQYITSYTYRIKAGRAPKYNKTPFFIFKSKRDVEYSSINTNYRSSPQIVQFLNNFSTFIKQEQCNKKLNNNRIPIYYIQENYIARIMKKFNDLVELHNEQIFDKKKIIVAKENNTVKIISQAVESSFEEIGNDSAYENLLSNTIELIMSVSKEPLDVWLSKRNLDVLQMRKFAMDVFDLINANTSKEVIEEFLKVNNIVIDENRNIKEIINEFKSKKCLKTIHRIDENVMSIHKSKGLEAGIVLAIAKNNNELSRWLEIKKDGRVLDENDTCRIGFVAFSRAKELLVISCLESINEGNLRLLKDLGVEIS